MLIITGPGDDTKAAGEKSCQLREGERVDVNPYCSLCCIWLFVWWCIYIYSVCVCKREREREGGERECVCV